MSTNYNASIQYGYITSKIQGNLSQMLKENDYNTLQQCETLEDIVIKLSSTYYQKSLTEDVILSKKDFKRQLNKSLATEIEAIKKSASTELVSLIDYFLNYYKLQNFVYLLACKEDDSDLERTFAKIDEIGKFNELHTLKFSNDMDDVYKFCVENTFLRRYYNSITFNNDIKENDFQSIQSSFFKKHIEDYYNIIEDSSTLSFMKDVLKCEGDRRIIELVINTMESAAVVGSKRLALFPKISSIDGGMKIKLSNCSTFDELKGILSGHHKLRQVVMQDNEDFVGALAGLEIEKYWESFSRMGDISCVYGYFKLKEQEIKNILWIVECISIKKKDFIKNIILPKEIL